ncbi:MAG: MBL fold metallo-hydrolase [Thermacetogeniaceae bacterium]|jgi:phosphoribosyl 1,2-cyclic phosphate phosphodiesterase|nr:MBL fold metallo-hydrolase [Syntrophomonadaceae bacterium]
MAELVFLGTGAGPGVPSFFCSCPGCQEAWRKNGYSRTRSGAALRTGKRTLLIDASPDLRAQLLREKISVVDGVFLTHWHYDHFAGLGELEYYVKLERREKLPLYLPPSAVRQFNSAFPNLSEVYSIIPWQFFRDYCFDGVIITPLPANHSVETAGFLIESGGCRLAYFSDTAGLPEITAKRVLGADWLICDATFYGENWFPDAHMSVKEAIQLGRQLEAKRIVLTHLSIHYSQAITGEELEKEISGYPGVMIGLDGMSLDIC